MLDVHYQINNQAQYAGWFDFQNLLAQAVNIPSISGSARGLSLAHAYVLACVHLQGHFANGEPIKAVWLYDIHLLLQKMSEADQNLARQFIETCQLGVVCAPWTDLSVTLFETQIPVLLKDYLAEVEQSNQASLSHGANPVRQLWAQFYYLPSASARFKFLRQLFFPASQRIRDKYPNSKLCMPILYCRRAIGGLLNRLAKMRM